MPRITVTARDGETRELDAPASLTLMDVLREGSCHREPGASRLSCQIRLSGQMEGLRLTIAPAE